jgi:cell division protein ZapA
MGEVTVRVNGRAYPVGCENGQEQHVVRLAELFDQYVGQVARDVGQLGDTRLFLLGALLLADELTETRSRLDAAGADLSKARAGAAEAETRALSVLEAAAKRIEALAGKAA